MTINDLLPYIQDIIDDDSKEIKAKIPRYCNRCQKDLLELSSYRKTFNLVHTKDNSGNANVSYDLGALISDFKNINFIVDSKNGNYLKTGYTIENKTLYVPNNYETTYRISYVPILPNLTALTDTFILDDDIVLSAVVSFVAGNLLTSSNTALSNYHLSQYDIYKAKYARQEKAVEEDIIDVYT